MASFGKDLFFFFLLVTFSSIQARESRFFSKFTRHYSIAKENGKKGFTVSSVPIQAPTLAPAPSPALLLDAPELAPAPAPEFGESEKGYGLFGEGSGMFPPKVISTTTTTADENELLNEELDGVTLGQKYENSNYNNNGYETSNYNYNNNNNGYKLGSAKYETGNHNDNGFTNKYFNNGYKVASESYEAGNQNSENGYTNNYNNNGKTDNYNKLGSARHETGNQNNNGYTNKYYNNGYKVAGESYEAGNQNSENGYTNNYNNNAHTNNYKNDGYETERQGMSDTRFMEGGKYYYNVKNENYYPSTEYESGKVRTQNQGSYGNDENPNEFNTMEEYESQEGYEKSQEESFP